MPGIIGTAIFIIGAIYGSFCLYLYLMQGRMIFAPNIPSRKLAASPADIGLEYDTVTLVTRDGVKLHGWYIPAPEQKEVLLFFHGNAGNISHRLDSLKIFNDLGLATLIIDYRGYGLSRGSISEHGMYLDAEASWAYLVETREIPAGRIIVFGRSLGAAVAAYIAAERTPAGLILESAFTSIPELGARMYPLLPVKLLSRYRYDNCKALQSVTCPVLVIHSRSDDIIPYENGRMLYECAGKPKEFLEIRGGHNDGFLSSGQVYSEGIRKFIAASLGDAGQGGLEAAGKGN
jgi:fermentation-respiration switch protein FrsA (DUF1100 family)